MKLDTAVEGGLSAKRKQDAVRALLAYHLLHKVGGDGKEIYLVGKPLGGLHSGDVGVDEDSCNPLLLHGLEGLGTGIVKLAGLADLQRAAAQQQHFLMFSLRMMGW